MRAWWLAPLALTTLTLAWYGVQCAWLRVMARPAGDDALARPGCAGPDCSCQGDAGPARVAMRQSAEVSPS